MKHLKNSGIVAKENHMTMIDCLSNLETEGSEIYNAIDNTSEEGTK